MFLLHLVAEITLPCSVRLKNQKNPEGSNEGLPGTEPREGTWGRKPGEGNLVRCLEKQPPSSNPGEATPEKQPGKGSAEAAKGRGGMLDRRPLAETNEGDQKAKEDAQQGAPGGEPRKMSPGRNGQKEAQGSQDITQRQEGTQGGP